MIKDLLDSNLNEFDSLNNLFSYPDPLQVVYRYKNSKDLEFIALICALFSYGNAKNILKFLNTLDFELLNEDEETIRNINYKYRFQSVEDVREIFITFKRLKNLYTINDFSTNSYLKADENKLIKVIWDLIDLIYSLNDYRSSGYEFFFGKIGNTSAYKRYCMYFRWMVRDSGIDLGVFKDIKKEDLLLPLDVHTHRMGLKLGLTNRKQADQKAMLDITKTLKTFDSYDPIKYDFALYRISQLKIEDIFNG